VPFIAEHDAALAAMHTPAVREPLTAPAPRSFPIRQKRDRQMGGPDKAEQRVE
jgi:hypothetical protein